MLVVDGNTLSSTNRTEAVMQSGIVTQGNYYVAVQYVLTFLLRVGPPLVYGTVAKACGQLV